MSDFNFTWLLPGLDTEQEVLEMRNRCLQLLSEGKTIISYEGEGTKATRQFVVPINELLTEINWFLRMVNPDKYGHIRTKVRPFFI